MAVSGSIAQAASSPIDVLLVDARQLVRAGIARLLTDSGYMTVCAGVTGFDEAIRYARTRQPKVILVNLPGSAVDVLDGARKIHRQFADIRVLVLSAESDLIIQERLLQSGVAGVVNSACAVEELFTAIETVMSGQRYVSDSLAQKMAERRLSGSGEMPFDRLTHRELQILLLVAEGRNTKAIARELCLTQKTVNSYRNRLLEKLGAGTEVELMYLALRHGLVTIPCCT
jgi:two-component system invasion response regulator UvrY